MTVSDAGPYSNVRGISESEVPNELVESDDADDPLVDPVSMATVEQEAPPDGGWGWFVVAGATLVHILMGGVERATGVMFLEVRERFHSSASSVAWIFSIFSTLRPILGPVGSALSDRFSCRAVVAVGGVLAALSLVMSGFAPSVPFLYFSFGVIGGIGQSLAYTPSLIIVGYYFNKRRGLAVGLATSGVGVGTFLLTPLFEVLFRYYGYQGAMLVIGGIVLNFVVAASLFRPLSLHRALTRSDRLRQLRRSGRDQTENDWQVGAEDDDHVGIMRHGQAELDAVPTKEQDSTPRPEVESDPFIQIQPQHTESPAPPTEVKGHKSPGVLRKKLTFIRTVLFGANSSTGAGKALIEWSLLKDPTFLALCLCIMLFTVAYNSTFVFLPSLATARGVTELQSAFIVSIIGALDAVSRFLSSVVLDLKSVKRLRLFLYNGVLVLIGGVCLVIPSCRTFLHFCLVGAAFGLLTGVYKSQKSVVIVDVLGVENLSSSFGLMLLFQGVGSLIGPAAGGFLRDALGSYDGAFYMGSVGIFLGAVVLGLGNVKKYFKDKRLV